MPNAGLEVAAPINIGVDEVDARVPDIGVVRPDVEMTSRAFHATAELVVEVVPRGEKAGEKLPFYAEWNVSEYLEIDLAERTVRLLINRDGEWSPSESSEALELTVGDVEAALRELGAASPGES